MVRKNEISVEGCARLAQMKGKIQGGLDEIYVDVVLVAKEVDPDWGALTTGRDAEDIWDEIYAKAKALNVDCVDGIDLSLFRSVIGKVKWMFLFGVDSGLASKAINADLKKARTYVQENLKDGPETHQAKMWAGYNWVKECKAKATADTKARAAQEAASGTTSTPSANVTTTTTQKPAESSPTNKGPLGQLRSFSQMLEGLILNSEGFSDQFVGHLVKTRNLTRAELAEIESRQAKSDVKKDVA